MSKVAMKPFAYLGAFLACTIMSMTTGCASGGFKLTREYAHFVNRQPVILRVILYIFTSVVFAVTMLIDMVVFNTMDFWNGTVAAGDYSFKNGDKTYQARHEFMPVTGLRRSTIQIFDQDQKLLQKVVLAETAEHQIEVFVDGTLKARVHGISDVPVASFYNGGTWLGDRMIEESQAYALAR